MQPVTYIVEVQVVSIELRDSKRRVVAHVALSKVITVGTIVKTQEIKATLVWRVVHL